MADEPQEPPKEQTDEEKQAAEWAVAADVRRQTLANKLNDLGNSSMDRGAVPRDLQRAFLRR